METVIWLCGFKKIHGRILRLYFLCVHTIYKSCVKAKCIVFYTYLLTSFLFKLCNTAPLPHLILVVKVPVSIFLTPFGYVFGLFFIDFGMAEGRSRPMKRIVRKR